MVFVAAVLLVAAAAPDFVTFPPGASSQGLLELTRHGEVWFLPVHGRHPFRAVVATRAQGPCAALEAAMMDVEGYKARWPLEEVIVLQRTPTKVRYQLKVDITLAPLLAGEVERRGAGRIHFRDPDTDAQSLWTLVDATGVCHATFSIAEGAESSSFVSVARAVEDTSGDSTNLAAAVASVRGYTKAEAVTGGPAPGAAGEAALQAIASEGTAIQMLRRGGATTYRLVRRVQAPPERVLWSIRDRRRYPERSDAIDKVDDRGKTAAYRFGFFGGRAALTTAVVEQGDPAAAGGLRVVETVTDGDVKRGRWTWTVRSIDGGTHVELLFDLDIVPGSAVLSALAAEDAGFKEGVALQIAGDLMGRIVGGAPIGRRTTPVASTGASTAD